MAEWTRSDANPRFIVTSLSRVDVEARFLCDDIYCARRDGEPHQEVSGRPLCRPHVNRRDLLTPRGFNQINFLAYRSASKPQAGLHLCATPSSVTFNIRQILGCKR
jgi:hypothetical protein